MIKDDRNDSLLKGPALSRAGFLRLSLGAGLSLFAAPTGAAKPAMLSRPIPSSGEALPAVGLGTWQTFDIGGDPAARAQRQEVLRLLFEGGGRMIDSSPMYGRSEAVVGELLAELDAHDQAFLATKVWTRGEAEGIRQMDSSFAKMRTARMDLMQIHNLVDWRTQLKTLRAWKEEGRIRYIGITHYTASALDDLAELIESEALDFVQFAYSLAVRDAESRLLPLAAERGVATLINRPYESGSLFRKVRGQALPDWAAEIDCKSWGQLFLKYILSHPGVTCVIPGTSKPKHLVDNLTAGQGRLPDVVERQKILQFWEAL